MLPAASSCPQGHASLQGYLTSRVDFASIAGEKLDHEVNHTHAPEEDQSFNTVLLPAAFLPFFKVRSLQGI
jgi:hypothetical protein